MTIGDGDSVGDDRLLVLRAAPRPPVEGRAPDTPVIVDDRVRITGRVRLLDPAAAERERGVDRDEALRRGWIGRPALIARSLQLVPRENAAGVHGIPVSTADPLADLDAFPGRTVTVTRRITRLVGAGAFVLGDEVLLTYGECPRFAPAASERDIGRDLPDAVFTPPH